MNLGEFLKKRRLELNLSLANVGEAISYTPQAISRFEKGQVRVDICLLADLAKVLRCNVSSFFTLVLVEKNDDFREFETASFANALYFYREKGLYTQASLAKKLNISKTRISKWEKGESLPSIEEFKSLCEVLNVDYEILYFGKIPEIHSQNLKKQKISFPNKLLFGSSIFCLLLALGVSTGFAVYGASSSKSNNLNSISSNRDLSQYAKVTYHYDLLNLDHVELVLKGEHAPSPSLKEEGYLLKGYFYQDKEFDFSSPIMNDITLIGKLEIKTYDVYFMSFDSQRVIDHQKIEFKKDATPPEAEIVPGYQFVSWGNYQCITRETFVYPQYEKLGDITVHLDPDGGDLGDKSNIINQYSQDMYDSLPKPTKKGYTFQYWEYQGEEFLKTTPISNEIVYLKAIYKANTYTITFAQTSLPPKEIAYGQTIEWEDMPQIDPLSGSKIANWIYNNELLTYPFTYSYNFNIVVYPNFETVGYTYNENEDGTLTLVKVENTKEEPVIIPSEVQGKRISKIANSCLVNDGKVPQITFLSQQVEIEEGAFQNLPNLKKVEFENITSSSVFALNIFVNCPNVTSLTIGEAKTPNGEPYYLKYYGLQGNETFKLTFNSSFKNIPEKFNEGFGKIHTVVLGDSIQRVGFGCIHTYGIDLKEFYPGSSLKELEIALPDLDQNILQFNSPIKFTLEGEYKGKVKQFILSQGGTLKNFKGFTANTFKSFGETKFINETLIASKEVHLGKNVSVYNTDTLFTNLDETGIDITFYGTKTIPSGISNIHFYVGTGEERIHFNNDITYEEIETGESSGDLGYEEIGDGEK